MIDESVIDEMVNDVPLEALEEDFNENMINEY